LCIRDDVENVFVQNTDPARGNRAHSEFFVAGHAEFPHNKNVERNAEPLGHFKRHRHATTRKAENDDVVASGVTQQLFRQLLTRVDPVLENMESRHGRSTN
jgi:hypothetical protein